MRTAAKTVSTNYVTKTSKRWSIEALLQSRATLILLLIMSAATALRLYRLNDGLWLDEILADVLYARMPFAQIVTTYESESQHFLYSVLAHASYEIFGPSPWALRLPAVLFGVGSILALYLFARRVTGPRESLFSAALLAFSYQHIWFSQNARGYTGILFWTLISSWLLLAAFQNSLRDSLRASSGHGFKPGLWLAYALTASLGLYTHMTMAFVVLGQVAVVVYWFFAYARHRTALIRGAATGFGGAALLSLLLYSPILPEFVKGLGREASVVEAWKNPLWTLGELVRGFNISFAGGVIALVALIVVGTGLFSYLRQQPEVVILLMAPVVSGAAVVILMGHHLWPRFFFFALGFGALVLMRGARLLGDAAGGWLLSLLQFRSERINPAWAGALACFVLVCAAAVSVPDVYGPKQDYAAALRLINTERKPGDAVVTASIAALPYKEYYQADWQVVDGISPLNEIRAQSTRTWFVYAFPPVLEAVLPEVMDSLNQDFQLVAKFEGTLNGGTVYVLRADAATIASKVR